MQGNQKTMSVRGEVGVENEIGKLNGSFVRSVMGVKGCGWYEKVVGKQCRSDCSSLEEHQVQAAYV